MYRICAAIFDAQPTKRRLAWLVVNRADRAWIFVVRLVLLFLIIGTWARWREDPPILTGPEGEFLVKKLGHLKAAN